MSDDEIRKLIKDESRSAVSKAIAEIERQRIYQNDVVPKAIKRRAIDGVIITFGLSTAKPTDGGAVGIEAWFSTDTGLLELWDGDSWVVMVTTDGTQTLTNKTLTTPVVDQFGTASGLGAAYSTFVPSWTNLTVGSGTNAGRYKQIGKLVDGYAFFIFGSGSSVGSTPTLTLPVAKSSSYNGSVYIGNARFFDSGTALYGGATLADGSCVVYGTSGTYATEVFPTATVPFTWTTSDAIYLHFTYEAA